MCKVYKALGHVYDSKILDMVFFSVLIKRKKNDMDNILS